MLFLNVIEEVLVPVETSPHGQAEIEAGVSMVLQNKVRLQIPCRTIEGAERVLDMHT
jgi:hypothetical protein